MSKPTVMGKLNLNNVVLPEPIILDPVLNLDSTALSVVKHNGKYQLIKIKFDKRNLPNDAEVQFQDDNRWEVQAHFNVAADNLFLLAEELKDNESNNNSK